MSVESPNQIVIRSESEQKKSSSVLKQFNNLMSRFTPKSSKPTMLRTDAVPSGSELQPHQVQSNGINHISPPQLAIIPSNDLPMAVPMPGQMPMSLTQNNLNQTNPNYNVIESQTNINISHSDNLQLFGHVWHVNMPVTDSRKNSCNSINDAKSKTPSPTTVGKLTFKRFFFSLIEPRIRSMELIPLFISDLLNCQDEIDTQMMQIAAQFMGGNWRDVFRDLDISEPEIEQIFQQYVNVSIAETNYQLLLKWKQNSEDIPSIGKLANALWNRENFKCVHELKQHFKKERRSRSNTMPQAK